MRHKHQLPTDEELISHINAYHNEALEERLERYKFVWQEFGPPEEMLLVGGMSAYLALEEIRLCYIEGFYLSCVLLAQVFIENSLGGNYIVAGDDVTAENGFAKLIEKSLSDKIIDVTLAQKLDSLRKMRNPYTHPKSGAGNRTLMKRINEKFEQGKPFNSPQEFAKEDAEEAIQTVVDFLNFGRFFGNQFRG